MRSLTRSLKLFAAGAALTVSLAGCGGDGGSTGTEDSEVEGNWSGTVTSQGGSATLSFTLSEAMVM